MKLTDTQRVILQSGARASDRLCLADAKLGAAPRHAIAKKLISLGLAEAAPCPPTMPPAHRFPSSAKAGAEPMALRITDAGLRAIGIEPPEAGAPDVPDDALEAAMEPQRDACAAEMLATSTRPKDAAVRAGRGFWAAAEEAAARGDIPPEPDLSAPTHAPYRKKLVQLMTLAQLGDVAGLRAVKINPTSTTPKALARWRDLAVRALEAREAGR